MSVLAYSELLRRIAGFDDSHLETPFKILSKNNTTPMRLRVIRALAIHEPISIGKLLQTVNLPRGGGSYLTIRKYFLSLEKEGLLERRRMGRKNTNKTKTLWIFSKKNEEFKKYILA